MNHTLKFFSLSMCVGAALLIFTTTGAAAELLDSMSDTKSSQMMDVGAMSDDDKQMMDGDTSVQKIQQHSMKKDEPEKGGIIKDAGKMSEEKDTTIEHGGMKSGHM